MRKIKNIISTAVLCFILLITGCTYTITLDESWIPNEETNNYNNEKSDTSNLFDSLISENKQINKNDNNKLKPLHQFGRGYSREIAISPDGDRLATSTSRGIYIYSIPTWTELKYIPAGSTYDLSFSPDGSKLAALTAMEKSTHSSSFDPYKLTVFSGDGQFDLLWEDNKKANGFYFSSDGSKIVTYLVAYDLPDRGYYVNFFDANTGRQELSHVFEKPNDDSWIDFSSSVLSGEVFAYLDDTLVRFLSYPEMTEIKSIYLDHFFSNNQKEEYSISPNLDYFAMRNKGDVNLWDLKTGAQLWAKPCSGFDAYQIGFNHDGSRLAASSSEGVCVWDIAHDSSLTEYKSDFIRYKTDVGSRFDFADKAELLVSKDPRSFTVWDLSNGKTIASTNENIFSWFDPIVTVSPNNKFLAAGFDSGSVYVWNLENEELLWQQNPVGKSSVLHLNISPDSNELYVYRQDDFFGFSVYNAMTGEEIRTYHELSSYGLELIPKGIPIDWDDDLGFINLDTGQKIFNPSDHSYNTYGNRLISPSGKILMVNYEGDSFDYKKVEIWEMTTGKLLSEWEHEESPQDTGFVAWEILPDEISVAYRSYDDTNFMINIYDLYSGQIISTLKPLPPDREGAIYFSPDSSILATIRGGDNKPGTIAFYNIKKNEQICRTHHSSSLDWRGKFSPDGTMFAIDNGPNELLVFDVKTCEKITVTDGFFTNDWKYRITINSGVIYLWDVP